MYHWCKNELLLKETFIKILTTPKIREKSFDLLQLPAKHRIEVNR